MTKRGIIEELLAQRHGFSHRESETIVNAMFDAMAQVLASGERIGMWLPGRKCPCLCGFTSQV